MSQEALRELDVLRIVRGPQKAASRRIRLLLLALVVALLTIAGVWLAKTRAARHRVKVETAVVTSGAATPAGTVLSGSGYVTTREKYVVVGTKVFGTILQEPIEEGQRVSRGDLLARIDDRDYRAELRQAEAEHARARAAADLAMARERRLRELFGQGVVSRDEFDEAVNTTRVASAEVDRSRATIDFRAFNVGQCEIRSPVNGLVLEKFREVGETINFSGESQPGRGVTDIVQLANMEDVRVEVEVNESDIARLSLGMAAAITPDAYPDRSFDGVVARIAAKANRQKGTVKVEVRFTAPDLEVIKPEMNTKVRFLSGPTQDVDRSTLARVPKAAVVEAADGRVVWVVRDDHAYRAPVILGRELGDSVEVRSGVVSGDVVILAPPDSLSDGVAIASGAS